MTSRVSFLKLLLETLRQKIAIILIAVLVFLLHIISFFMNVQNVISGERLAQYTYSFYPPVPNTEHITEDLLDLSLPNLGNSVIAMVIGVFLAFAFFRYLHSKKECDFYESLPLKKQTQFGAITVSCIGLFLILATLTTGIELGILFGTGYCNKLMLQNMLWNLVCMIGSFLVAWVTTALAFVMTGHLIVAFLGLGIFSSYIPLIIAYLIPTYAETFLETYVFDEISTKYYYFSPVTLAYKASHNYRNWNLPEHWKYLVGCFVFALIIGFLAYQLFLKRPSETAGRAMAFEKANSFIRFFIVIPLALYAGLFLSMMASFTTTAWLIFGVLFGTFLLHGIMECIFHFDIKALISKKKQLLFTMVFCLAFVFTFMFDLFGFDNYVPKAKDLKSVKIHTYLFDEKGNETDAWADGLSGKYIDEALLVIKDLRENNTPSDQGDDYYMNDFTVTYQLKNGTQRKRQYSYYGNAFPESLDKLYATEAFKDDYCILYHLDETSITSVGADNGLEHRELVLTETERQELFEIYLKEYTSMTLNQELTEATVFELTLTYPAQNKEYTVTNRHNVYESCKETIAFLKERGLMTFAQSENIKPTNLELYNDKYSNGEPEYISDETKLKELKQHMILSSFISDYNYKNYIHGTLRYELNGHTRYIDVLLPVDILDKK